MKRMAAVGALGVAGGVGAAVARWVAARRRAVAAVPPALRSPALWVSFSITSDRRLRFARRGLGAATPVEGGVGVRTMMLPGPGGHQVRTLVFERPDRARPSGALLWIHGGGLIAGSPEMGNAKCSRFAAELDVVVVAPDYRLAPEHPFPNGLDDCAAALRWLHDQAESLGVDPDRIAVGGDSAGGGLAAALAQRSLDRGGPAIRFQLLQYPMLDDRTATVDTDALMWSNRSNAYAWEAYLGHAPGEVEHRPWAVPARRDDLAGLPPAWIGVGTEDLFHAEAVAYARRLEDAGVPCELHVEPGMYHGADLMAAKAPAMRAFRNRMVDALADAIGSWQPVDHQRQ